MKSNCQPEIFAGLYVVALVLSWATLFSLERFGATDVKSWAPFLQAVLSGVAIFSAWWLQDRKRVADRKETEADTVTAIVELSRLIEWAADRANHFAMEGTFSRFSAVMLTPSLHSNLAAARAQKAVSLPTREAITAFLNYLHCVAVFEGALAFQLEELKGSALARNDVFTVPYRGAHDARTILLRELGVAAEPDREERP